MFSLISGLLQYLFTKPKINLLLIGLDHAGKTTLLEKIKSQYGNTPGIPPDRKIPPTIGLNLARIANFQGTQITLWDLGGQIKVRTMWERYYESAHAILFLVDAADIGRLEEAKLAYESICDNDNVEGTPIFILANKQDLEGALSPADITLNFHSMDTSNSGRSLVYPISAITGEGLQDVMENVVKLAKIRASNETNQ